MTVEVEEAQLTQLQNAHAFLAQLAARPETRREFERLAKKLKPDLETSDDVAEAYAAPIREELSRTTDRMNAFLTAQEEAAKRAEQQAADRGRDEAFARLRAEGYTEEAMPRITQLMIERNIADPEAAAALFNKLNPKPSTQPQAWEPDAWNFKGNAVDVDVEGLFKDPDSWADQRIGQILLEERSGRQS